MKLCTENTVAQWNCVGVEVELVSSALQKSRPCLPHETTASF